LQIITNNTNQVLKHIKTVANQLSKQGHINITNEIIWYLESLNLITRSKLYTGTSQLTDEIKHIIHNFYLLKQQDFSLQSIMNQANFYGRDFYINRNVLIPRPETETIITFLKSKQFTSGLEIGVGSGIISITLRLENIVHSMTATDISQEALDVCNKNIQSFNISNIQLFRHDILNETIKKQYDIIISNPPYISLKDYKKLPNYIKKYEPSKALTDNADGLTFYKRFIPIIKQNLKKDGLFICEIGLPSTYALIKKIFLNQGYDIQMIQDLNKDPRILIITQND
tara:strand:- start:1383 stop:2237 length:855 start_codon:yes stop_codon:yes gene_type:complete